jgi:hypothetical protein
MNPGLIIILVAGAFLLMNKNVTSPTGSPMPVVLTTDQKRKAIISWWETNTPPVQQATDNGTFIDIINNISAAQIDTIYTYIFSFVMNGTRPAAGSAIYNAMQIISNEYNIFQ